MVFDEYFGWVCLGGIIISLISWSISLSRLINIKKTNFRNLWEKDKKKETFWRSYERQLADEIMFKKPYWIEASKNADVWLWIYRSSTVTFLVSGLFAYLFGS